MRIISARRTQKRKLADIEIGASYAVRVSGRFCRVQIKKETESSGIWLGINEITRMPIYVALRDLGARLPALPAVDRLRVAAGDRED